MISIKVEECPSDIAPLCQTAWSQSVFHDLQTRFNIINNNRVGGLLGLLKISIGHHINRFLRRF